MRPIPSAVPTVMSPIVRNALGDGLEHADAAEVDAGDDTEEALTATATRRCRLELRRASPSRTTVNAVEVARRDDSIWRLELVPPADVARR